MKRAIKDLILASQSPRRKALLEEAGYEFTVMAPDQSVEQGLCSGCTPEQMVSDWALRKALDIARQVQQGLILSADTIAELDGQILGKPRDEDHAFKMLRLLSGRVHRVLTGVCLLDVRRAVYLQKMEVAVMRMDPLTDQQIEEYVATDGWVGKAGAFGFQDGPDWLHLESGLASAVVGLPVERLPKWIAELAELQE
ncbi:MAG: nucleoside triphosphate pyrophosphatase [Pirellulaceae bacterium]